MDQESESSFQDHISGPNTQDTQSANAMYLRLDTNPLLAQYELYLRGVELVGYEQQANQMVPIYKQTGPAKMNAKGIQAVMGYLKLHFNPLTVQGNMKDEDFQNYIYEFDERFSTLVMVKLHEWQIKIDDYDEVCQGPVGAAQPFFSRTINNEERKSYNLTLKTTETNQVQPATSGGLFGLLRK